MTRNPMAGSLRNFKPKRIEDKRETEAGKFMREAAEHALAMWQTREDIETACRAVADDEWHPLPRKSWDEG